MTCRVLGFSKQAFFKWRKDPVSQRDWDNAHLTNAAFDLHRDDPAFGYRFISDEIEAEAGLAASERLDTGEGIGSGSSQFCCVWLTRRRREDGRRRIRIHV